MALLPILFLAITTACGDSSDDDSIDRGGSDGVIVTTPVATRTVETPASPPPSPASPTSVPASPTPQPTSVSNGSDLEGFIYPIVGGCLPQGDQLMPNAPRPYRQGTHEGVDFYAADNCTPIGLGTQVHAAKAGRVIRVDTTYADPTPVEMTALLANPNNETSLDAFRGRQVWVDHGNGIVTRYCHLSDVAAGLAVGDTVAQGEVIAYVGESGTPESVNNPGHEYHLHFELRIGASYLGAGESPTQVRALYRALFE